MSPAPGFVIEYQRLAMMRVRFLLLFALSIGPMMVSAQVTMLPLSSITPGTENVQLVYNGDFQFQGPMFTNAHPFAVGWNRQADMFADSGVNMTAANNGVVCRALVNNSAPVSKYERTITLQPNTSYVLSAYLWNFGTASDHVTTVIDMNDVFKEPQITLSYFNANADQGYFVYRTFNTADTG